MGKHSTLRTACHGLQLGQDEPVVQKWCQSHGYNMLKLYKASSERKWKKNIICCATLLRRLTYGCDGSSDYPKPHPEETPRDWMEHCGFGYYCTPFVDNLAGWSESIPQMGNFPRRGSFKPEYLGMAFRMIYEGQEDPGWNHPYTQESLQKWYDMKTIWDKYLNIKEHKALLAKMPPIKAGCKPKPPVPVRPPPYNSGDDEVYVDVLPSKCPGGKSTPNVVAPSVMSSKGKTVGASAPRTPSPRDDDPEPLSEEDDGLETDGPDTRPLFCIFQCPCLPMHAAAVCFHTQGGSVYLDKITTRLY
ncbi:hypothetical protein QTP86_003677 [Hemibagrus guttatus]|nr:hypothetical protein QTP86_003677 [Hemibagrus guttatus]